MNYWRSFFIRSYLFHWAADENKIDYSKHSMRYRLKIGCHVLSKSTLIITFNSTWGRIAKWLITDGILIESINFKYIWRFPYRTNVVYDRVDSMMSMWNEYIRDRFKWNNSLKLPLATVQSSQIHWEMLFSLLMLANKKKCEILAAFRMSYLDELKFSKWKWREINVCSWFKIQLEKRDVINIC